jgi:phosphoglycolate phosphatase
VELKALTIEAVIFDLDGTLANFNLDFKTLRGEIREYLMHHGIPSSVLDVNESIFEMLKKTQIFIKNTDKSKVVFEALRVQALNIAEMFEMEAAKTTSLLPGAVETLKELKKLNLKMGLCTTSSEKAAFYIVQRFRINDFFQVIVSRDKVKYVKPSTEQFEFALKSLGVSLKDTLIVGDSVADMHSGNELKAVTVGLTTGFSSMEQLIAAGANYIITSLTDLPELVVKINKD